MHAFESKEFLKVEKEFGFLKTVTFEDVVCRFPACKQQAHELQRHEHVASRDAVLHQDPRHEDYMSIFKRWITLSFCNRHQKQFHCQQRKPTRAEVVRQMHANVEAVVSQLRLYYLTHCRIRRGVPGSWPGATEIIHPDDITVVETERIMQSYKKRFDSSCVSVAPNPRSRKASCSFRTSVTNSLSSTQQNGGKPGFVYIIYSKEYEGETEDKEQIVKIGYSKARPEERIQDYGNNCNPLALENTTWKGHEVYKVRYAKRVEYLVHSELRHYGHQVQHLCAGHGPRIRQHGELFQVPLTLAIATIKYWISWIEHKDHKPYDENGHFCAWPSLCSPNLSKQGVRNQFLLDSQGNSWFTHKSNGKSTETYSSCEVWQDCTCPAISIRKFGHPVSQSAMPEADQHVFEEEIDLNRSPATENAAIAHVDSAKSPTTLLSTMPARKRTSIRDRCSTPHSRCESPPESPPSLIASSDCSTPFEDSAVTPHFDMFDSQSSYKSALSYQDLQDSHGHAIPTPMLSISDSEESDQSSLTKFDGSALATKYNRFTTPTRQPKTSQTTLHQYLNPSPVPEARRRSVGDSVAGQERYSSKTFRGRMSLGV